MARDEVSGRGSIRSRDLSSTAFQGIKKIKSCKSFIMQQSTGKVSRSSLGQHELLIRTEDVTAKGHACKLNLVFRLDVRQCSKKTSKVIFEAHTSSSALLMTSFENKYITNCCFCV